MGTPGPSRKDATLENREMQLANMEVVRRLLTECLGEGLVRHLPNLIAAGYVGHLPIGDHYGPEGVRIDIDGYRAMMSNLSVTLDDLFADADKVCRRFTLRGTLRYQFPNDQDGRTPVVLHGVAIDRLEHGLLVESWVLLDSLPDDR